MKVPGSTLRLFLCSLLVLCGTTLQAQQYMLADDGATVKFTIVNRLVFSSTVNGYFKGLKGTVHFDPHDLKSAAVDATVAVNTISTGIGKRNRDLMGEKYFNTAKYPAMRLLSTSVAATDKPNTYHLTGALTIKGVTKTISFPFTAVVSGNAIQLNGQFTINRMDFGVGPDNTIDKKLTVELKALAKKQ